MHNKRTMPSGTNLSASTDNDSMVLIKNEEIRIIGGSNSSPEMEEAKKLIAMKIKNKKVMLFSKSFCSNSDEAKSAFEEYLSRGELSEEDYEVMELEERSDMDDIQEQLRALTGARSVPRVFINGNCIGGGDETATLHKNGKLLPLMMAAE